MRSSILDSILMFDSDQLSDVSDRSPVYVVDQSELEGEYDLTHCPTKDLNQF
jgi:hypothetical protein